MGLLDDMRLECEKSQTVTRFVIEGEPFPRVQFGDEKNRMSLSHCPECDSGIGSFHMLGCTIERCPLCDEKARDCSCSYEKRPQELLR
jgi:hypothetical protein